MREIHLSNGGVIVVDDDVYETVAAYKWRRDARGYARRVTSQRGKEVTLMLHRVILGAVDGDVVDHVNGNPLDNRRQNLRLASLTQNRANVAKVRGSSRYKGVTLHSTGRWQAACSNKYLGLYETEEDAALAYDAEARIKFGPFAAVNFPSAGERCALKVGT